MNPEVVKSSFRSDPSPHRIQVGEGFPGIAPQMMKGLSFSFGINLSLAMAPRLSGVNTGSPFLVLPIKSVLLSQSASAHLAARISFRRMPVSNSSHNACPANSLGSSLIAAARRGIGRRHAAAPFVFAKSLDFGSRVGHFPCNHSHLPTASLLLATPPQQL